MAITRGSKCKGLDANLPLDERGVMLAEQLYNQFNTFHSKDIRTDVFIEVANHKNMIDNLISPTVRPAVPKGAYIFTPSSADKCDRDLFFHLQGMKKSSKDKMPYHKRWTRNSTAVHEATQKDLLYMAKYAPYAPFQLHTVDDIPQWEENIKTVVNFEYKDKSFALSGMMDGILMYKPEEALMGFEFKTKTNSVAQIGNYKMKDITDTNKAQAIAYSIMFGLDEFIFMYEAVAKDNWMKNEEARPDIRTFYFKVTEAMRIDLKEKFYRVATAIETGVAPERDCNKCIFCEYKGQCAQIGDYK